MTHGIRKSVYYLWKRALKIDADIKELDPLYQSTLPELGRRITRVLYFNDVNIP